MGAPAWARSPTEEDPRNSQHSATQGGIETWPNRWAKARGRRCNRSSLWSGSCQVTYKYNQLDKRLITAYYYPLQHESQGDDLTRRYSNTELVTLAVYLLGGRDRFIDTEDVAMKTHELSPGRFSWRKHAGQINLELVRVRLSEAKSEAHGALIRGSTPRGWTLTAKGLVWALGVTKDPSMLTPDVGSGRQRGGSVDAQRTDRERARIASTSAWAKWPAHRREISTRDAEEVFRIDSYATGDLRATKVERLRKCFSGDTTVTEFIDYVATALTAKGS